jgi:thiol:disulfide interchange protein DsbA
MYFCYFRDVMKKQYGRATVIGYSLFLIVISALMTVLFYHIFIFQTFTSTSEEAEVKLIELSAEQVKNSPIKDANSIIEVMSYGCHFCAANEENVARMVNNLPEGVSFSAIHIVKEGNPLAAYAPVFATLEEMGIEKEKRDEIYNSVIARGVNLANDSVLEGWLVKNNISVDRYDAVRQSQAVKDRLNYMAAVSQYYNINATPMFIVNKRYVLVQDGTFPEFAQKMIQLLQKGEQNP